MERKIVLVLAVFLTFLLPLSAQMQIANVDSLSFVRYDVDTLAFDRQNSLLIPFFEKFHKVTTEGVGNVNIVHIGSSHVQAGTLSHTIRRNLLLSYPNLNARRGMLFPYGAANKCNNPADYRVKRSCEFMLIRNVYKEHITPLGLTGIAVYVENHPAELKMYLTDDDLDFCTTRIVLLGEATDNAVTPWIRVDSTYYYPVIRDYEQRRFVFENLEVTDSFAIVLPCDTNQRFTITGVLLDNDNPGLTFHSTGVNGGSLSDYLRCPYFENDIELLEPDMVIFGIGINDANSQNFDTIVFAQRYRQLIQKIKNVNPECAFVFITNNDSYKRLSKKKYVANRNNALARDVFYRLAEETNGAVWDQFDIMGGLASMKKWRDAGYGQYDRIHFTNKGYKLLGNLFFNAFVGAYDEYYPKTD